MPLEEHYLGDENWYNFVSLFKLEWQKCPFKTELVEKLNGMEDLAMVLYGTCLNSSLNWVENKIPALDGLTPIECLKNDSGIKRLKTCLNRMPR